MGARYRFGALRRPGAAAVLVPGGHRQLHLHSLMNRAQPPLGRLWQL